MKRSRMLAFVPILAAVAILAAGCAVPATGGSPTADSSSSVKDGLDQPAMAELQNQSQITANESLEVDEKTAVNLNVYQFTLKTVVTTKQMAFIGVGASIDGEIAPVLKVPAGAQVRITLINGDGAPHDIYIPELNVQSSMTNSIGDQAVIEFTAPNSGQFDFYSTSPGDQGGGLQATLMVGP